MTKCKFSFEGLDIYSILSNLLLVIFFQLNSQQLHLGCNWLEFGIFVYWIRIRGLKKNTIQVYVSDLSYLSSSVL